MGLVCCMGMVWVVSGGVEWGMGVVFGGVCWRMVVYGCGMGVGWW